jgi:predicted O-methyltransferase YrrM
MDEMVRHNLDRFTMFVRAADFVNFEAVAGDVLEFGTFGGVSLALLARSHEFDPKGMTRRIVGYDSFRGLPPSEERHGRWKEGDCASIHGWHPFLRPGEPVSEEMVRKLFDRVDLAEPELEVGDFRDTLAATIPAKYRAAAIVHIDCDLYESAKMVLTSLAPILQEGTVVLFDEWFSYKGNPGRGEARAFAEFLDAHAEWGAQHYQAYGPFSNSFILYRK